MTVLIASQLTADTSTEIQLISGATVTLMATDGIDTGEDTIIEIETDADGWTDTQYLLTKTAPLLNLIGPITFRVTKTVST